MFAPGWPMVCPRLLVVGLSRHGKKKKGGWVLEGTDGKKLSDASDIRRYRYGVRSDEKGFVVPASTA